MSSPPVVTIVYNTAFYVYKFRMNLIAEIKAMGFRVVVISPIDEYVEILNLHGIEHHPVKMSQYGMNPLRELMSAIEIYRAFKRHRPIFSLHYTIKPNIFGNFAAAFAGVSVINNIAGAGRAFSGDRTYFQGLVSFLYKQSLRRSRKVFFQNNEDMEFFLKNNLVASDLSERIPGSGVDLKAYSPQNIDVDPEVFRFLFIGRLLKEKGIVEYLTAAQAVAAKVGARRVLFEIVGELGLSKEYICASYLDDFLKDSSFIYHGTVSPDVMPSLIAKSNCVVLPSAYREGVPRSLLEAAAMSKPIVTTDNVGCRDVVVDGYNGFTCPVRDANALSLAMLKILHLSTEDLMQMGRNGRKKVEEEFDEGLVLAAYERAIFSIIG